ncbi:MAG: hypothetical protein WCR59_14010 [Planctomycetota bacterium]
MDDPAPVLPPPVPWLRSLLLVVTLAGGGLGLAKIMQPINSPPPKIMPNISSPEQAKPSPESPPAKSTSVTDTPKMVADAAPIHYPDGSTWPSLNGVTNPPPIPWPQQRPFAPVVEQVVDVAGVAWYRHQDGSLSTVRTTFRKDLNRDDAYGMVMLPTEVQPQIDAAATAKQSPLRR